MMKNCDYDKNVFKYKQRKREHSESLWWFKWSRSTAMYNILQQKEQRPWTLNNKIHKNTLWKWQPRIHTQFQENKYDVSATQPLWNFFPKMNISQTLQPEISQSCNESDVTVSQLQDFITMVKTYILSYFLLPPSLYVPKDFTTLPWESETPWPTIHTTWAQDEIKWCLTSLIHYVAINPHYNTPKQCENTEKMLFGLLCNPQIQQYHFDWIKNTKYKFIEELNKEIEELSTIENQKLNSLLQKFIPSTETIPQSKVIPQKNYFWSLWYNSLYNIYFCEFLTQIFWHNDSNIISINNQTYHIYYPTLWEDQKWVDLILVSWDQIIGIDFTTSQKKHKNKRKIQWYTHQWIFTYNQYFQTAFKEFISRYNNYITKEKQYPLINPSDPIIKKFKHNFEQFIIQYQNNTPSCPDQDTDNSVLIDL